VVQWWFATEKEARDFVSCGAVEHVREASEVEQQPTVLLTREHTIVEDVLLTSGIHKATVVFAVSRRSDLTAEQFQAYYLDRHPDVAAFHPGLSAYQQFHVLDHLVPGPVPVDGITMNWSVDESELSQMLRSSSLQAGRKDVTEFCDVPNMEGFQATDYRLQWPQKVTNGGR
jgi:hypothetical protein